MHEGTEAQQPWENLLPSLPGSTLACAEADILLACCLLYSRIMGTALC